MSAGGADLGLLLPPHSLSKMPSTPKALSLPRWVDTLRSTLTNNLKENKDLISYAFASIDHKTNYPKVRYVVHRGFVNERRKDKDGSNNLVKDQDDKDLISDKLVVTTDARSVQNHSSLYDRSQYTHVQRLLIELLNQCNWRRILQLKSLGGWLRLNINSVFSVKPTSYPLQHSPLPLQQSSPSPPTNSLLIPISIGKTKGFDNLENSRLN